MEFSSEEMSRLNNNPFYQALRIVVEEAKEGKACSDLRPLPTFCWPFVGQPHGGILFTVMDTTMAWVTHQSTRIVYVRADILDEKGQVGAAGHSPRPVFVSPSTQAWGTFKSFNLLTPVSNFFFSYAVYGFFICSREVFLYACF